MTDPILVFTTGGTIDKLYFDALSEYKIGDSVVERLLRTARVASLPRVVELMRKDSLDLTDEDRAAIATAVRDAAEHRIVITHGTDTMTETAAALGSIAGKVIVFVGALAPARFAESDATFNLGMAFATAQAAPPGVYITMTGQVFDAARVRKDRAANAFVALPYLPAANGSRPPPGQSATSVGKSIAVSARPLNGMIGE